MSDDDWDFDEEELEDNKPAQQHLRPQLLVGIDTHPSMFVKTEEGLHAFYSCLLGLDTLLDQLLLKSDKQTLAVILAHDSETKAVLLNFDMPTYEKQTVIKKLLDLKEDALKEEFMRTGNFDFASFLLLVKKQFQRSKADTRVRTFLFITNDSDPVQGDAQLKFRVLNEAENFPNLKIGFELATMSEEFRWEIFYEEMYKAMGTTLVKEYCEDEEGIMEKIAPHVEPVVYQRSVPFYPKLSNLKIYMKVLIHKFFKESHLSYNRKVTCDRHAEVRSIRMSNAVPKEKMMVTVVMDKETKKSYKVKKPVKYKDEEALKKYKYPVGYSLIGVTNRLDKPEMVLQPHYMMVESPKENLSFFKVFWKYCGEKNKVLLCCHRPTKRSHPQFCEFIPKVYNNTPAFLVKYLYFLEDTLINPDIPEFDDSPEEEPVDETVKKDVTKLVDALTFSYDPTAFNDVSALKEHAYIKAQVLEQDMEDVDDLIENDEQIDKIIADLDLVQKRKVETSEKGKGRKKEK